jgi:hypothetical protein
MLGKLGGGRSDRLTCTSPQTKLKKYIAAVHRSVREEALDTKRWKSSRRRDIPQQKNTSDCGCFILAFADQEVLQPTQSCPGFSAVSSVDRCFETQPPLQK